MCLTLRTVPRLNAQSIASKLLSILAAFTVKQGTEAECVQTVSYRSILINTGHIVYSM